MDVTRITDICVKYEITYDEYMLLYTRFIRDYGNMAKYLAARADYHRDIGEPERDAYSTEQLERLELRGYIEFFGKYHGKVPEYDMKHILVTPKFSETIWVETWEAGEQLFKVYPDYLSHTIKGQGALAKSCNVEEYMQKYSAKIWSDVELHNKILGAVANAEKVGEIKEGIAKFIDSMPFSYQRLFKLQEDTRGLHGDMI